MTNGKAIIEFLLEDRIKLATVSGIYTTKPAIIEWASQNIPDVDVITTKSYQVNPNQGNREPIIAEPEPGSFVNAVGLRNPGMLQGIAELATLRKKPLRSMLNVSLSANSIEDFITLARGFSDVADILELNFSCPHVHGYGAAIGSDPNLISSYVKAIRPATEKPIFVKLTPNVENIGQCARAAVQAGVDGISAINTHGPITYNEINSGKPVLSNQRGGKSGSWIKEIALDAVRQIRQAVGREIPIIGIGGVSTGEDVANMIAAGANVVGIGSALARVQLKPEYFSALREDATKGTKKVESYLLNERLMEYRPHKIIEISEPSKTLRVLTLSGEIKYSGSQFAYIWIPGAGEKPFSIALEDPLTFVARKKEFDPSKGRGIFTNALFELRKGDIIYVRVVYGKVPEVCSTKEVRIIAAGTGIATVPKLAEWLDSNGKEVTVFYGVTKMEEAVLVDEIGKYAAVYAIEDAGEKARVLKHILGRAPKEVGFYNIGPHEFMHRAMAIEEQNGANPTNIFSSLETNCMCGIGMCGECECGGKLLCQEGTFVSLKYLQEKGVDIRSYNNE